MKTPGRTPSPLATPPERIEDQIARLRREQQRLVAGLQAGEQHFRGLARSVWRVEEEERRRIARDLHDGVGQDMTALRHRIEAARAEEDLGQCRARLDEVLTLCDRVLEDTRGLARLLRPQILDDFGLEAALRWIARRCAEAGGCTVDVDLSLGEEPLGPDVSIVAFRTIQESLTNVIRHSKARHVSVRAALKDSSLNLLVADDGCGFEVGQTRQPSDVRGGAGLSGMRERIQLFGGACTVTSAPGEGVQVRAKLPLRILEPR